MSDPTPNTTADKSPEVGGAAVPIDPRLRALARSVDKDGRRIDALDTLVTQLAADLTTLARYVQSDGTSMDRGQADDDVSDAAPAERAWLLADDPDQAAADLDDLCAWIGRVYLRYPRTELPSCWLWHPHAVEELRWLRRTHAEAYDPETGSWLRVGDWHDRQLPGVAERLTRSIGACELSLHLPGQRAAGLPQPVPFADAATAVAYAWTASSGRTPGPEPTRTQLARSDAEFDAQHRSRW